MKTAHVLKWFSRHNANASSPAASEKNPPLNIALNFLLVILNEEKQSSKAELDDVLKSRGESGLTNKADSDINF